MAIYRINAPILRDLLGVGLYLFNTRHEFITVLAGDFYDRRTFSRRCGACNWPMAACSFSRSLASVFVTAGSPGTSMKANWTSTHGVTVGVVRIAAAVGETDRW